MQHISRGPRTIDHDLHAQWEGTCGRCREHYDIGTVIVKSLYGYQHAVCPRDIPADS